MSELRSAVEPFQIESLGELADARIQDDLAELQRAGELIEVERVRRVAEIERRRLYERDGHLSAASWLVDRFRVGSGAAHEAVRMGRGLAGMPRVREALDGGEVSLGAARVLVRAREEDPVAFEPAEATLVEAARDRSVAELQRIASHWRLRVAHERALQGDEQAWARRGLWTSVTFLGGLRVGGDLDPVGGESLLTALRAVLDTEARARDRSADPRSPAQQRADALGEICRQWLDRSDRPSVGGERPHLTVTVPLEALRPDGVGAELDHAGALGSAGVRQLACDAAVMRIVMTGTSQPLDVGRRTPVIPAPMRRAVIVRDRTCRFPACERPHTWCDAHHVDHWADGGGTSVANLLLLCRRHHRMVHRPGGFRLELVDGVAVFHRPDGSPLEGRAPP